MKKNYWSLSLAGAFCLAMLACKNQAATENAADVRTQFIDSANMDFAVKPGDNFWMYANGGWFKTAEIPSTESGVGAFLDLRNKTKANLKSILDEVSSKEQKEGSIEQQVADFYASGMDSAAIDKRGYEPIKPTLDKINALTSPADVVKFIAEQQASANNLLFGLYIGADDKNSSVYLPIFVQGGLGLPDRDYYFKNDAPTLETVAAYKKYVTTLLTLTGDDSAKAVATANAVYELEKQLASAHKTNVDLRDPEANYNKMSVADAAKQLPKLDFANLVTLMKLKTDSVNIGQPQYFKKLDALVGSVPLDTWKQYLRVHTLEEAASLLSSDFEKAAFAYGGTALSGQTEMKPRWQRMIASTDNLLGDALGQLYVKKFFTEDAKKRMAELVNNLSKAFENRINHLDWMSDSTKQVAIAKLHTFIKKIGYPDTWKDYSSIKIDRSKYFENVEAGSQYAYNYEVSKLGKPVDRTEWGMTPPTINAYYNPSFNEIVFPAGILQFPFFDANADDAINYGGIGMVIGHEMSHGFDDQGSQYDKDGNLKNWWSKDDLKKFGEKGARLIGQFNSFTVLDSLHVNGALTQGENIGDLGGVAVAYDAFKMTKQGQDTVKIDGFTPDQRFFLSLAQIWRGKQTDKALRQQVLTNPHSPGIFRVNGPLMNFEPFYKAFNVQPGDKMYLPENERVKMW